MGKRVATGKFVMTIIGAHMIGRIPHWVDTAEVTCRTWREVQDVEHYARVAELTIEWGYENNLSVATMSFCPEEGNHEPDPG